MDSREIEHAKSQDKGLARQSSVAKKAFVAAPPIHPGMADRTSDTVGAAPTGRPADAVHPSLYSTTEAGKSFDIPKASWDAKDGDGCGIDPAAGHKVMAQAKSNHPDFAKRLHTKLPDAVTEETSK
jgi:hypothetical protein